MIYPAICIMLMALMFVSLYFFDKASLSLSAGDAAERSAFIWDNSHKDPLSGSFPINQNDGLYWRVTGNGILSVLGIGADSIDIKLPDQIGGAHGGLTEKKLLKVGAYLPQINRGTMRMTNTGIERKIEVQLERSRRNANVFSSVIPIEKRLARAKSYVTEPAEFIRTIDLIGDYGARLKEYFSKGDVKLKVPSPQQDGSSLEVHSEAEAREYVRSLVGGRTVYFETEKVGERRKIDVLDGDGIAHEAKYTMNEADARQQLLKDVELMQEGKIKGAVWHFFRHAKKGTVALTPSIQKELDKYGIVVVIHN